MSLPARQPDYLKIPRSTLPSFHFRTGSRALLTPEAAPNAPANAFGYPNPGPQSPTAVQATAKSYFVDSTTWNDILDHGEFDDVVVGSGFCALAYVEAALKLDPFRKILVLERGEFWLPEHFQNMPLPFKFLLGGPSETFPWQLSSRTFNSPVNFMRGSCPFFGGRSTFWSAWCPRATDLMRNFPESMLETSKPEAFWTEAEELLHVTKATDINDPVFGKQLQDLIQTRLDKAIQGSTIPNADFTENARLAVGRKTSIPHIVAFEKFSTPGPLLAIYEKQRQLAEKRAGYPLMFATDVVVHRFETDPEDTVRVPTILHTSRGALCFPRKNTNVILAAGAFPATTLLMNSVGDLLKDRAGSRVGGHFLTHIAARFPIDQKFFESLSMSHLQIGASYLAGKDPETQLQYHVQITAIHSPNPEKDAEDAGRLCPDYAAAATAEQLAGSEHHIVLICATLGELDETYKDSWVKHNPNNPDVTTNIRVQALLSDKANNLWNIMDKVTYDAISVMAGDSAGEVEFWHDAITETLPGDAFSDTEVIKEPAGWKKEHPPQDMIRVPGVVHETSMLYMSDNLETDKTASVDQNYRPRGCNNVYVTGGALFPSSGSWNPTLTMCGFAQDLAKKLHKKKLDEGKGPEGQVR